MSINDQWSIELSVGEHDSETFAEIHLAARDGEHWSGRGKARRNPADRNVTEIGEEIALARALSDLAHRLLHAAAADVENITHEQTRLHL